MVKKAFNLVFALFLLTFAANIFAQSNSSDQKKNQNQVGITIKGVVTEISMTEKKIIIQDDLTHDKKSYIYNDRTTWRNGTTPCSITDLKDGDRITVIATDNVIARGDISSNNAGPDNSKEKSTPQ
jgi:hypothetical protein